MLRCAAELTDPDVSKKYRDLLASQTTRTPNLNDVETSNPVSGTYTVLTYVRTYIHINIYRHTHTHTCIIYTREQPEECLYS